MYVRSMRAIRYVVCDVFTDRPLTGNQLAVFTDARSLDDATMQALACEMRFSESVFVVPPSAGGHARLRIFTPNREIPFAGHPTLGAAFVLGQPLQTPHLNLETGSGLVPVILEREGARVVFGWMRQPLPVRSDYPETASLLEALGLAAAALPVEQYDNGLRHVLVAAPTREAVGALRPDFRRLAGLPGQCFSVFAGEGQSWKTRVFAPGDAIDEDPATGSAAGPVAVHLARHGLVPYGSELLLEQGAEIGRPSRLFARCHGSSEGVAAVEVGGAAVVVARGEFRIP